MKGIITILGGLGVGAALMYLFDPNGGRRRRALIRDKAVGVSNDLKQGISSRTQDMANRAKGMVHQAESLVSGRGSGSDQAERPI